MGNRQGKLVINEVGTSVNGTSNTLPSVSGKPDTEVANGNGVHHGNQGETENTNGDAIVKRMEEETPKEDPTSTLAVEKSEQPETFKEEVGEEEEINTNERADTSNLKKKNKNVLHWIQKKVSVVALKSTSSTKATPNVSVLEGEGGSCAPAENGHKCQEETNGNGHVNGDDECQKENGHGPVEEIPLTNGNNIKSVETTETNGHSADIVTTNGHCITVSKSRDEEEPSLTVQVEDHVTTKLTQIAVMSLDNNPPSNYNNVDSVPLKATESALLDCN